MMLYQMEGVLRLLFCAGIVLAVPACSLDAGGGVLGQTAAPPPPLEKNKPPEKVAATPSALDTLRALSPPEGLKFTPLFGEPADNPARIKRLEGAVQGIRNDLDTVVPAVVHMVVMERDNRVLAVQQQGLPAEAPALPGPQAAPAPAPAVEKKMDAPPPAAPAIGDVKRIRIADHADKTRIVLDMTVKHDGTARLEKNGRQLVVPLSRLNWLGLKSFDAESAELISGYRVADGNLYVELMYAAQIKAQDVVPPGGAMNDYRTVIDLFSSDVHK